MTSERPHSFARSLLTPSVLFAIVLVVVVQAVVLRRAWPTISEGRIDFRPLYDAGTLVLHRSSPGYQLSTQQIEASAAAQTTPGVWVPRGPDQLHPPFELLIFAPLAALPYEQAYLVWYGCNSLILATVLVLLWKHAPALSNHFGLLLFAGTTAYPVLASRLQGQDSTLLLFLLTLSFLSLKQGHELRAGVALGLGMFKFLLVGPIVLVLLLARKWRALSAYGVTCIALLLASFALIGTKAVTSYWLFIFRFARVTPPAGKLIHMPNLREFFHALAPRSVPAMWVDSVVIVLSVLILLFVVVRCAKARRPEALDLTFTMLVTTAVVTSYHLFLHNATILLLPVVVTANYLAGSRRRVFARALFLIAIGIMYFAPFFLPEPTDMLVFFCGSVVLLVVLYASTVPDLSTERLGASLRAEAMQDSMAAAADHTLPQANANS